MMDMSMITSGEASCLPPSGLALAYEVVTRDEEFELLGLLEAMDVPRFALDPDNPRSKKAFGWDYHADGTIEVCPVLPREFDGIRGRAADMAGIGADELVQAMLTRYDPGSIIQWHTDKPVWEHVVGLSLGETVTMGFRKAVGDGWDLRAIELPPRSFYMMRGEARYVYEHGLPPAPGVRWSITFRSFSHEGLRRADCALASG
jgi:alkylated DNA repair dioxygenase AlkB